MYCQKCIKELKTVDFMFTKIHVDITCVMTESEISNTQLHGSVTSLRIHTVSFIRKVYTIENQHTTMSMTYCDAYSV